MPDCDHVLFVSSGMSAPKKRDHILARRQQYLNYGALTLATLLDRNGQPAILAHGGHEDPSDFLEMLELKGLLPTRAPLMLSLPSFFALPWAQDFYGLLRARHPSQRIVAGGRWVTGPDPSWLKERLPVDRVVTGLAEHQIMDLAAGRPPSRGISETLPDFSLDHRLTLAFETFQPSIETSRGCGMGCAFCEERAIKLTRLRSPEVLANFFLETCRQYGSTDIHPYLQSSFFLPNPRWAADFSAEVKQRGVRLQWRCETRVDGLKPQTIEMLAAAGMKVIDLGLETASPRQAQAMNKSPNVERYLSSASEVLRACEANGVWAKVNVLLYAGETTETYEETREWLHRHSSAIKGVSVGPVIVFGPPSQARPLLRQLEVLGAAAADPSDTDRTGISRLNLSAEIGHPEAEAMSLALSREFMDIDDYFDLKSFSYYPRGYSRADFDRDVAASDPDTLPFRVAKVIGAA